jgi:hypothetical protein
VGLGERSDVTSVEVRWPDSDEFQTYPISAIDRGGGRRSSTDQAT